MKMRSLTMVHWGGADGRSEAVVLAVEVPGHSGAPLSKCMRHVGAWARRMQAEAQVPSDRRTHGPMVFRVDSMHHVDRWAPVQGGAIVPVLVDGQPPRSIDAMDVGFGMHEELLGTANREIL